MAAPGTGSASAPGVAATPSAALTGGARAAPASTSMTSVPARSSRSPAVHRVRGSTVAGHLHPELPAVEERSVHGVHGVLGVALVQEAHEGEAAALLGVPVPGDVHVPDAAVLIEHFAQGVG